MIWTKCSERLPKKNGRYLVWFALDGFKPQAEIARFYKDSGGRWSLGFVSGEIQHGFIAWAEIVEPSENEC